MTSVASTSETLTAGNNTEKTGPMNDDQHQQNYSEALIDEIFSCPLGPSGPTLEIVPEDLFGEENTIPADDYSVVQIPIPGSSR